MKRQKETESDLARASTGSQEEVGTATPDNRGTIGTDGPQFAEPAATPDPTRFIVRHGSDTEAYKILDNLKGKLQPRAFPISAEKEPKLTLAASIGTKGDAVENDINKAEQIVFHAAGDTGNTRGPRDPNRVVDKMVSDFNETDPRAVPSFFYHLGDVVYSFGEASYYYDQFYDMFRDYPTPILAIPGNHDGMVSPLSQTPSLQAFLENFCTAGKPPHRTAESGELVRTAQIQPGVYFTFEAPFVRILGLYSNCLEDPGVISDQGGTYAGLTRVQLDYLDSALTRIKKEKYPGAILIAVHHPPYVATTPAQESIGKHGGSPLMNQEIDSVCAKVGVWPHAVLSGHAHNYQRFTRHAGNRQTPYIVVGNGGHAVKPLTQKGAQALRVPTLQKSLSSGSDTVVFENYDDQDFGYLRVLVNRKQLRIEYHPAADGEAAKTPDDSVTVDIAGRKIVPFQPI